MVVRPPDADEARYVGTVQFARGTSAVRARTTARVDDSRKKARANRRVISTTS
jgi:hypothetical protein